MIRDFFKNNWQILSFNIILLAVFVIFYGRFGDVMVDSFREAYIPSQIIEGQTLYKNIFTIYAPLPYLFNALLFLIFGANLKVLYFAGFLTTAGILNLVYKISEKFLDKIFGFGIVLFIISAGVLSPNVFNMVFPYSYGILYGLLFILFALYFALRKKYFWAYFFYSLAICSKYEFLIFLPVLVWYCGFKGMWKNIFAFLIPITACFITLILQGVTPEDLLISFKIMTVMPSAKTLGWFYSVTGLAFRPKLLLVYAINLAKMLIPLALISRFDNWQSKVLAFACLCFLLSPECLVFTFPLILILFGFKFKNTERDVKFVIISSLLVSLKVFFATTLESYGVFFLPFALISLCLLIPQKYRKALLTVIILSSIIFGIKNSQILIDKNIKIATERGIIRTSQFGGEPVKQLVNYINKNSEKIDTAVVFPECLALNFLADRKSDNKFYSLIPLYVEIFGDDFIIERLEAKKPKYIIISDYDTSNYYYSEFGKDYAKKILKYTEENYNLETKIDGGISFDIYKRR